MKMMTTTTTTSRKSIMTTAATTTTGAFKRTFTHALCTAFNQCLFQPTNNTSSSSLSSSSSSSSGASLGNFLSRVSTNNFHRSFVTAPVQTAVSVEGRESKKFLFSSLYPTATASSTTFRSHYSYNGPGIFTGNDHGHHHRHDYDDRGYTVGIGGPVGSGKTALVLALTRRLSEKVPLGVVTNDIFTQEDAEFLTRNNALPSHLIRAVETGGCPHAAIREDVSSNLTACEDLTRVLAQEKEGEEPQSALILCESGGDNLAANFSRELADLTLYVIDVAGGDKVPRKGGPGITQSDLLIINKIDLADAVGADLNVMRRDADKMRRPNKNPNNDDNGDDDEVGPTVFASVRHGTALDEIEDFILKEYAKATTTHSHEH